MPLLALSYRVTGPIQPAAPRDRLPYSPAPGAIPRGEPLLPSIETLLYALGPLVYAHEEAQNLHTCEEVLHDIIGNRLGLRNARIYGPFLRAETMNGPRIYVNVSTHLLDLQGLERYARAADLIHEALETPNPSRRNELLDEARDEIQRLEEEKLLIPWEAIAQRRQRVTLDYARKAHIHGLLHSETRVDYTILSMLPLTPTESNAQAHEEVIPASNPPELILLIEAEDEGRLPEYNGAPLTLTPLKTPAIMTIDTLSGVESLAQEEDEPLLATSPTPYTPTCLPVHPVTRDILTIKAHTCKTRQGLQKTQPITSYKPGTILYGYTPSNRVISSVMSVSKLYALREALRKQSKVWRS